MQTALAILAIPLMALLPMALGRRLMGRASLPAEHYALGLLVLGLLMAGLGAAGLLVPRAVVLLSLGLALPCIFDMRLVLERAYQHMLRLPGPGIMGRVLMVLLLLLLAERALRCLVPTTNWDSLGHHLLLVRERLQAGDLGALWHVPTDRRTPLAGVLVKAWAMAFDSCGRTVLWLNLCIMLAIVHQVWTMARERVDATWALLATAFFVCLTDAFVHSSGAGDEPLLALLLLVALRRIAAGPGPAPLKNALFTGLMIGFALAVKLTVLFWLPLLLAWALVTWRRSLPALLCGIVLAAALALPSQAHGWLHYRMVFPLTRWSNLLHEGGDGRVLLDAQDVRADRTALGLAGDTRDRKLGSDMAARLWHNLLVALQLPVLLYPAWCLWLGLLYATRLSGSGCGAILRHAGALLMLAAGCLLVSSVLWPLSPQAMMRYHMPTWPILLLGCALLAAALDRAARIAGTVLCAMAVLALFSLTLEARVLWERMRGTDVFTPARYWRDKVADGPLLERLAQLRKPGQAVFYCGSAGFLLKDGPAWFAQAGNESGWRPTADMPAFLEKNAIAFWVLGHRPSTSDRVYDALTTRLLDEGLLVPLDTVGGGRILAVRGSRPADPPQTPSPRPAP